MTSVNGYGRLAADSSALRLQVELLTRQVSTGRKAEAQGDIAPDLPRALTLRAEIARRDTYGTAISEALSRSGATQTALQRLGDIAREFADDVAMKLDPNDPNALSLVAPRAKAALVEVGQLLDSQSAGEYLFGGSDLRNPPVPDPEGLPGSGMAQQVAAAVASLGGGNAAAVAAATRAAAMDDSPGVTPFSAFLSDPAAGLAEPRRAVPAGDGQAVPYGLFANRNAAAASAGETTGSWARDLLRGLASLAALTPAQTASPDDFRALAGTIRDGLRSAADGIADEAGALGLTEARLTTAKEQHATLGDALKGQLSDIEEVDLAATLSRLQSTRTALEASYTAIGRLGELNLTRFLP
ncbi:flagellin [Paracraurococcus lichenis]|uniref:Flagellin n=1 Tax=Paracraurococcus lichenis TaxID=3064888 RepID=A0ABT9E1A4_9PROT|nr:flagellin [Paracraurococcus sp. LOR1-02]MDO9709800.1 flagellin [Paracraurococcus sp. LOR1-02]